MSGAVRPGRVYRYAPASAPLFEGAGVVPFVRTLRLEEGRWIVEPRRGGQAFAVLVEELLPLFVEADLFVVEGKCATK